MKNIVQITNMLQFHNTNAASTLKSIVYYCITQIKQTKEFLLLFFRSGESLAVDNKPNQFSGVAVDFYERRKSMYCVCLNARFASSFSVALFFVKWKWCHHWHLTSATENACANLNWMVSISSDVRRWAVKMSCQNYNMRVIAWNALISFWLLYCTATTNTHT